MKGTGEVGDVRTACLNLGEEIGRSYRGGPGHEEVKKDTREFLGAPRLVTSALPAPFILLVLASSSTSGF